MRFKLRRLEAKAWMFFYQHIMRLSRDEATIRLIIRNMGKPN